MSPLDAAAIAGRLAEVRGRIAAAAERAGRNPAEVTLVGISKRMPVALAVAGVRAGLDDLGENYVQEARAKIPAVAEILGEDAPRWHYVGALQRNKAKDAVALFDVVQSVDRASLARELARRAEAVGRRLAVHLQVNLSGEEQKAGCAPEEAEALLAACAGLPGLEVQGLMTLPAPGEAEAARPAFARLRDLRERLAGLPGGEALRDLSMGMSADFEVAVEEGATLVRVGTAIFGPRES